MYKKVEENCMRNKIGRKLAVITMGLMIALTGIGMSTTVFADTTDTIWSFNLNVSTTKFQYLSREKQNNSKIYINWQSSYGGNLSKICVTPKGSDKKDSTPKNAGTVHGGSRQYIMNGSGKYSLTNGVYEMGYKFARPGMRAQAGKGTAKGCWSPDSAGTYTVLQ